MKHEVGIPQPNYLTEDWPGKYDVFSWLEYVVTVPNPIFLITTRKANGAPDACLHSWGFMVTDPQARMQAMGLMYNVRGTVNPLDGQFYGPNTLGLLNEVVKVFDLGQSQE